MRRNALILAVAPLTVLALAIAAASAPAQATPGSTGPPPRSQRETMAAHESNEQIVADFLGRKERAERAQRAIVADLRRDLERRRAEFDAALERFDQARGRYVEIVGPLAKQGFMHPEDPRLPYAFDLRRDSPAAMAIRPAPTTTTSATTPPTPR